MSHGEERARAVLAAELAGLGGPVEILSRKAECVTTVINRRSMLAWRALDLCALCIFVVIWWSSSGHHLPTPAPQLLEGGGRLRAYFLPQPCQVPFLISSSLFFLRASTVCSSITW